MSLRSVGTPVPKSSWRITTASSLDAPISRVSRRDAAVPLREHVEAGTSPTPRHGREDASMRQPLGAPLRPTRNGPSGLPHTEPMPALAVDVQFRRHAGISQRLVQRQALFRLR
jgi:hypothetical protein